MQRRRKLKSNATDSPRGLPRVPRRVALQGLGALALGGLGCGSGRSGDVNSAQGPEAATGSGGVAPSMSGTASGGSPAPASAGAGSGAQVTPSSGSGGAASNVGSGGASGSGGAAAMPAADAGMPMVNIQQGTGGGAAVDAGLATPTGLDALHCIVTPAMTDGPFFVDEKLERSNLIMGESDDAIAKAVPLHLVLGVFEVTGTTCKPLSGVQVDIWQANAIGVYSDVAPGLVQAVDTQGKQFLRGYQITDEQGVVRFDTIYPGWYMSRTIHIHFKLRMLDSSVSAREFTSQMFFDETINAAVLAKPPYSGRSGTRSVLNDDDHIFNGTAANGQLPPTGSAAPGKDIMPTLVAMGAGYTATLKIGVA